MLTFIGMSSIVRIMSSRDKLSSFEGGATRSSTEQRFDLIPQEALDALVRRLTYGAGIHGEHNWKLGGDKFVRATKNHLLAHILDYNVHGNLTDANTDAIICNAAFLCWYEAQKQRFGYPDPS